MQCASSPLLSGRVPWPDLTTPNSAGWHNQKSRRALALILLRIRDALCIVPLPAKHPAVGTTGRERRSAAAAERVQGPLRKARGSQPPSPLPQACWHATPTLCLPNAGCRRENGRMANGALAATLGVCRGGWVLLSEDLDLGGQSSSCSFMGNRVGVENVSAVRRGRRFRDSSREVGGWVSGSVGGWG